MLDCDENCWKLELAIAHDNSQGLIGIIIKAGYRAGLALTLTLEAKARKFDGAVWTLIELCSCQSLLKPGASQLVLMTTLGTP
ncbi:hypothetical protein [Phormidium nigroviride]